METEVSVPVECISTSVDIPVFLTNTLPSARLKRAIVLKYVLSLPVESEECIWVSRPCNFFLQTYKRSSVF